MKKVSSLIVGVLLAGCNQETRMGELGGLPRLTHVQDPNKVPGYRPVQLPMPDPIPETGHANSLWQPGARGFFKDQRAARVGDLLTVLVTVDDKAKTENTSERSRTTKNTGGVSNLFGLERAINTATHLNPAALIASSNNPTHTGTGKVDRKEEIRFNISAIVTQVLPNGNLVIAGRQEIRVNYEIREIQVAGIIRREDISASNAITNDKISEARISYGGRGMIDDVQAPPYGQQVLDMIMPF